MKRYFLLILISTGILPLFIACFCKQKTPHWNMTNFEIQVLSDFDEVIISGDTILVDTMSLNLKYESIFVAQNSLNTFGNQLFAFQCPEPGEYGLRNKIKSIAISCDKQVNSHPPNVDLMNSSLINNQKLSDFLYSQQYLRDYNPIQIKLTEKPMQQELRIFTISIIFEDNSELIKKSADFYW